MSFMRYRILVSLLAVTIGVAYAKTKLLEDVPLQWKPTSALTLGAMETPQAAIQFDTFTDQRSNPQAIGENREDEGKPKPVTTKDDVGAFVSTHMRELLSKAGLTTVDANGTVTIKGEVKQFFVTETNTYQAQVIVHLTVVGKNGAKLWSGLASGEANRFGRSYKLENYHEALSDAIVDATSSMLKSAELQKVLAGH